MGTDFRYCTELLRKEVESLLQRIGILCQVFGRGKDNNSLVTKLNKNPDKYALGGKLIQDAIGIRVALYFSEDIDIVANLLNSQFLQDTSSSTVDLPETDQFTVTRHNLIFKVPENLQEDMARAIGARAIDDAFEIQLRSILSEGWHEVEHDLRYKSKSNWEGHNDLSRALNGIIATIETAEWTMRKIFDDLAYRNYKAKKWPEMLHNRVRMRTEPQLSDHLCNLFDCNPKIAKNIFRIDRMRIMFFLSKLRPSIPTTLDNIVYAWNYLGPQYDEIIRLTPQYIHSVLTSTHRQH